jgi:RNA polymerase sigma factor (TIGR02999 family)
MRDVTRIPKALGQGDPHAAGRLPPVVYAELRRRAAARLAREKPGRTLDATALVHEAYLRLAGPREERQFANRGHFLAAAPAAMRRILIDRARARRAAKRGGDRERVAVEPDHLAARYSGAERLDTDSVLDGLARTDAEAAELVRLHVFRGAVDQGGRCGPGPVSGDRLPQLVVRPGLAPLRPVLVVRRNRVGLRMRG